MVKLFSWLIFVVVAIPIIVFAVTNRQVVSLDLWPLPQPLDLPLYLLVVGTLVVGLLVGLLLGWLVAGKARRRARAASRRASSAEHQAAVLRDRVQRLEEAAQRPSAPSQPGVPTIALGKTSDAA